MRASSSTIHKLSAEAIFGEAGIYRGGVIVQTRSLIDTLVSLKDHLEKTFSEGSGLEGPWIVGYDQQWDTLSDAEKYWIITGASAFWHLDFTKSWALYPRRLEVSYEAVTRETVDVVSEICAFFKVDKSMEEIEQAVTSIDASSRESKRFNVGVSGRGLDLLPAEIQDYVERIGSIGLKAE